VARLADAPPLAEERGGKGFKIFTFRYSPQYAALQEDFEQCAATHDPQAIAFFHRRFALASLLAAPGSPRSHSPLFCNMYHLLLCVSSLVSFRFPWHAQCLLQLAYLHECQGGFEQAHNLIRMALHMHQVALPSDFELGGGGGAGGPMARRMSFDNSPNRDFYCILFKHAQLLGKKGCPRTALE